jgi:hypothetical protein
MARHLEFLDQTLLTAIEDAQAGLLDGLVVCMPPQHGKSELISKFLPAWYLGTYPDRRVILASYEADFAAQWGRKARDLLERWGWLWGVQVARRSSAVYRWDLQGREGGMTTAGAGGAITGRGATRRGRPGGRTVVEGCCRGQAEWRESISHAHGRTGCCTLLLCLRLEISAAIGDPTPFA